MSENFRTGAGAASRPRDEDLYADRSENSDNLKNQLPSPKAIFLDYRRDSSPYLATVLSYPLNSWPEITASATDRADSGLSSVFRPPTTETKFYSIFIRWPDEAGLNNLLGLFIKYRTKGSLAWQVDLRNLTPEIDSYSPSNSNKPNLYVTQLYPSVNNEYQIATKYIWTPDLGHEFATDIFDGADFEKVQPFQVGETVKGGSALFTSAIRQQHFSLAILTKPLAQNELITGRAFNIAKSRSKFFSSFVDTVTINEPEKFQGYSQKAIRLSEAVYYIQADFIQGN